MRQECLASSQALFAFSCRPGVIKIADSKKKWSGRVDLNHRHTRSESHLKIASKSSMSILCDDVRYCICFFGLKSPAITPLPDRMRAVRIKVGRSRTTTV
jgi:hypothetical protein